MFRNYETVDKFPRRKTTPTFRHVHICIPSRTRRARKDVRRLCWRSGIVGVSIHTSPETYFKKWDQCENETWEPCNKSSEVFGENIYEKRKRQRNSEKKNTLRKKKNEESY